MILRPILSHVFVAEFYQEEVGHLLSSYIHSCSSQRTIPSKIFTYNS